MLESDVNTMQIDFWAFVFFSMLMIPSIVWPILRFNGKESKPLVTGKWALLVACVLLPAWGGLIFLGNRVDVQSLPGVLAFLVDLLAIVFPILFFLAIGSYTLKIHSGQRAWGAVNFSQAVTFQAVMFFEVVFFAAVLIFAGSWLMQQAELFPYLTLFESQGTLTEQNLESLANQILPLVQTPLLYFGIVLALALIVPMIEEFFKPLAVWVFAGKDLSPREGFFLGLICGGIFALVESLLMLSMATGEAWGSVAIGRAGTSLMHITTAGLLGWVLAKTWRGGRYWQLSLAYLVCIFLHGTWNLFAVMSGLSEMLSFVESDLIAALAPVADWVLAGLSAILFGILLTMNHHLKKVELPPALPGTIIPPEIQP